MIPADDRYARDLVTPCPERPVMQTPHNVENLLEETMSGCDDAAAEFCRIFERQVRVEIRIRLSQLRLQHLVDSVDVAQNAFADFMLGLRRGIIEIRSPQEAISLLMKICRSKVAQELRFHTAEKRDMRRTVHRMDGYHSVNSCTFRIAAAADELRHLRNRFNSDDFRIFELRALGCSWEDIASQFSSSADAIRMRAQRLRQEAKDSTRWSDSRW